ncbi:hypothetical protein [uncultured Tenacibaculum sp.]|uniref:hypothetical protein n=1 Tax=uncultured Tenacibaculum sp. TaxID=174713 RepID=UPI002615C092|nr:hypothetical protein [uncultured Tenacibaculum sp.]
MKKIQLFTVILLFMFNNLIYSQSSFRIIDSGPKNSFTKTSSGFYRTSSETSENLKRVHYYEDFNNKAIIFDKDNKKYKINNFNIDLIQNYFISKINKDSLFVFSSINKVIINKKEFLKKDNKIYEVLAKGNRLNLEVNFISSMREEIIDKLNGKIVKPAHYIIKKEYLLENKVHGKKIKLKKIKKKLIFNHIEKSLKKQVQLYVDTNNLSFRKEEDLKNILNYYNSL